MKFQFEGWVAPLNELLMDKDEGLDLDEIKDAVDGWGSYEDFPWSLEMTVAEESPEDPKI